MPSFNAHYFFANQELDFIKKTFPDVKINESALYYGAQGPDLMYFARLIPGIMPGKTLMDVGDALHAANPTLILTAMRNYFRENPNDDIAKSFMLGFICHYTLDRNAHPFVYSIEDTIYFDGHEQWDRTWIHNVIEHQFDSWVIRKYTDFDKANKYKGYSPITKDKEVFEAINRALLYITPRATDVDLEKLDPLAGYHGAKDTYTLMHILQDSSGAKYKILGGLINNTIGKKQGPMGTCFFVPSEPLTDYDYFNESHKEWHEPKNPDFKSTDSLEDIFNNAYKDLEEILPKFAACLTDDDYDIYSITEDMGFDTSLKNPRCENPVIAM